MVLKITRFILKNDLYNCGNKFFLMQFSCNFYELNPIVAFIFYLIISKEDNYIEEIIRNNKVNLKKRKFSNFKYHIRIENKNIVM